MSSPTYAELVASEHSPSTTGRLPGPPSWLLQNKCACHGPAGARGNCEECRKKDALPQRRHGGDAEHARVRSIVKDVVRSPGQPLDQGTRAFFEPRFGHDFSQVRVHNDSRAAESARSVNALAYTSGDNIVFGTGCYGPESSAGRKLLAHELTHVVQQSPHSRQSKALISDPSDAPEQEANRLGDQIGSDSSAISRSWKVQNRDAAAVILPYRTPGAQFFARESDPALGLTESAFRDPKKQPWIESIRVVFDGTIADTNPDLSTIPAADRLMATGKLHAVYHKNEVERPAIDTPVGGGSAVLGLTDRGDFEVHRIEGVGYNAAAQAGEDVSTRIPGTKYTKDPDPGNIHFMGAANMHYAVFFKDREALHLDGPDGLRVGSHACVHVPNPPMQQINFHSVTSKTKVSVSYSSATALSHLCEARFRRTGFRRNPC